MREARSHARDARALRDRLRAELLERAAAALRRRRRRAASASRMAGSSSSASAASARRRAPLRPLPRPHHVPDPRCARPRDRLRRTHHRCGRAEVPELARDRAVSQGTRALRVCTRRAARVPTSRASSSSKAIWTPCGCTRRASITRSQPSARPPPPSTSGACFGSCPRWCSPSTATAPAARPPGARCSRHCPRRARGARSASCSCPKGTIRIRWSAPKAVRPSRSAAGRRAAPVRVPGARALASTVISPTPTGARAFAEAARPLFAKVPQGVYRELLLERLAEVVGSAPQRLAEAVGAAARGCAGSRLCRCADAPPRARRRRGAGAAVLCARRSCGCCTTRNRQRSELAERAGLDASEEPGVALLRELLDDLREQPAQIPAQVVSAGPTAKGARRCRNSSSARKSLQMRPPPPASFGRRS